MDEKSISVQETKTGQIVVKEAVNYLFYILYPPNNKYRK